MSVNPSVKFKRSPYATTTLITVYTSGGRMLTFLDNRKEIVKRLNFVYHSGKQILQSRPTSLCIVI